MESCLRFSAIILVVVFCSSALAAQPGAGVPAQATVSVKEINDANLPAMPFLAEITSDDIYVRSGPGTNYYYCGKLKKADKVKVVGSKFSWWQIVPPAGSYCWISKQYVQVAPQDSTIGTVIGDAVRVYAGSDDVQPMHSTTMLVKLNNGDKVTFLGEEKESYCKIAPPEGAYLWVSNQYVKPLGSLMTPAQPALAVPPAAPTSFPTPGAPTSQQATSPNEAPGAPPVPAPPSIDDQKTGEVRQLKEQVDAEKAKPIDQQNFAEIKKKLADIAGNKEAPRAARGAQGLLRTIERCELAQEVLKADNLQEQQFGQTRQRIENAHAEQLANFEDLSVFAVIGWLRESPLFADTPTVKYYRVVDGAGKTLCFAKPTGVAVDVDLSKFIDKKVGLVGTIEPNAELGDAVVQFTNIAELK